MSYWGPLYKQELIYLKDVFQFLESLKNKKQISRECLREHPQKWL